MLRGVSAAGFVTWISGFLTVAHVIPKCLLMAHELEPERGVPSEPPTELIPFLLGVVSRAILVVRTIRHLRSERISFAVVPTEDRTRVCENTVATRPFRSRSLSQSYSHL